MLERYVKPYTKRIIINSIIKTAGTLFEVMMPAVLAYIIDSLVPENNIGPIIFWGVMMIVFSVLAWIGNVVANRMAAFTASRIIKQIRHDLFVRAMNLSPRQLDIISISSLETRLTTDTYNIHRFLGVSLRMGIRSLLLFTGGIVICFILEWKFAMVLLLIAIPIFIIIRTVFSKSFPIFRTLQDKIDDMVQVIREDIVGVRVSKALDKTEYEEKRFAKRNEKVKRGEIKLTDHMSILFPSINVLLFLGQALVILLGAYLGMKGSPEAGKITAFMSYFIQIANSLMAMNRMINIGTRAKTSSDRVYEILTMPKDDSQIIYEPVLEELPDPDPEVPEVEFRDVSFAYEDESFLQYAEDSKARYAESLALHNISFKVYPGETLGLIGATGSGKSSIIRLLLRMYDPQEGEILIRGVNIKHIPRDLMHHMFGIVLQNDFIFSSTIENNIKFGREVAEDELAVAIQDAQAKEFIDDKEGGLQHRLVLRGLNLSGGQRQRVLLSRALSSDPEILILDDSSSALDFATDAKLRQALNDNYQDTTSFIIAQRVSSIMHADNILVIDNGAILDQGTHEELMETCDIYKEVADMQIGQGGMDFDSLDNMATAKKGEE